MADVYVYHGPDNYQPGGTTSDPRALIFRKGQYIFINSDTGLHTTYCNTDKHQWYGGLPEIDGDYSHIRVANKELYGSHNYHPASGGTMYTIRKTCNMRYGTNGANLSTIKLYAGDVVIIGASWPQGTTGTDNYVRMWGYRRGGRSGVDTETFGYYCESRWWEGDAKDYTINTE